MYKVKLLIAALGLLGVGVLGSGGFYNCGQASQATNGADPGVSIVERLSRTWDVTTIADALPLSSCTSCRDGDVRAALATLSPLGALKRIKATEGDARTLSCGPFGWKSFVHRTYMMEFERGMAQVQINTSHTNGKVEVKGLSVTPDRLTQLKPVVFGTQSPSL